MRGVEGPVCLKSRFNSEMENRCAALPAGRESVTPPAERVAEERKRKNKTKAGKQTQHDKMI